MLFYVDDYNCGLSLEREQAGAQKGTIMLFRTYRYCGDAGHVRGLEKG